MPLQHAYATNTTPLLAMTHVLREVSLPNVNAFEALSLDDTAPVPPDKSIEKDREEEGGKIQETVQVDKENVSQLDYGVRDECQNDEQTDEWSRLDHDHDPLPEVASLSEDFFRSSLSEGAPLVELPQIIKPATRTDPDDPEADHPVVAALEAMSSSTDPDVSALKEIVTSQDLPASLREAYPHSLIPSIYGMMLRHTSSIEAQVLGAQLLQKAAIHVPNAASEIGQGNGIQLIIHSMLQNKDCVAVQTAGAAALAALCSTAPNRTIAGKFYAVEAIVSATQIFAEERYLQGACMKLLAALASEPENMDIIVNTRSIRLPFRVIKRHRGSRTLVRIACECAHVLLKGFDETDMETVAQMNPMKLFLCAIVTYSEDERIQVTAIECATVFCSVDNACLLTCLNARASDICVRNLRRFRGSEHARLHLACMEMLCLFADEGFQKTVISAGALEACLTCMIEMRRVFAIQICCLRMLEQVVATGDETCLERIVAVGGLEVLNTSLKVYIEREEFVERGVRVMRVLRG